MRPTLEDYKLKGPCAYPHLMRRNGSKQYGVIGKRSLTTPKMATVDLVSESSQLASQQTQSSCASSELIGSSVTHDHNSDDTVVGSSKGNAISSAKPAQKEESISMKLIGQGRSPHRISVTRSAWDQTKIEERKQPVPSSSLSSPTLSVPSLPLRSPTLLTDTQSSPITYLTNVHPYQNDSPMQQWLTSSTACYHHPSSALMPFYDLGSMPYGIHPYMSINNGKLLVAKCFHIILVFPKPTDLLETIIYVRYLDCIFFSVSNIQLPACWITISYHTTTCIKLPVFYTYTLSIYFFHSHISTYPCTLSTEYNPNG